MMKAANRLDTVQEYYFSKKLREVRALSTEGKPCLLYTSDAADE